MGGARPRAHERKPKAKPRSDGATPPRPGSLGGPAAPTAWGGSLLWEDKSPPQVGTPGSPRWEGEPRVGKLEGREPPPHL